jgi:hypothetical protein
MTNIEMNPEVKSLLNNEHWLHSMLAVPVLSILAFTGCSSLDGTAEKQPKNGVAVYSEWQHENPRPADSDPAPAYQWFY